MKKTALLRAFLYLLIRDHLTLGAVERLMMDIETIRESGRNPPKFSSAFIVSIVDDLIERLLG